MRGFVEAIAEHEARGWAFDEANPDAHLTVSAWLGGSRVGGSVAAIMRRDLKTAGIGDGDHGFRIAFDPLLPPAALPGLELRAERGGQSVCLKQLPGTNQSLADAASDATIPFSDPTHHPVFVLGPARSGTSALALALLKSGRYQGHGEGHLMPLAQQLLSQVDAYYGDRSALSGADTLLRRVHKETFQRFVRRSFVQLMRAAYPSGYWIDKTPTAAMVRSAPLMLEIWPNARFIFLKRRVIENIISRRRKFPQDTLQNHYLDWVDVLSAWRGVKDRLGQRAIEADQLQMARSNDVFSAEISAFLGLTPTQAETLRITLASDHPEQTSERVGMSATLESLGLHGDNKRELRIACDPIMEAFGYSYDENYYL